MNPEIRQAVLRVRRPFILLVHLSIFALSYWLSFQLRFDFRPPAYFLAVFGRTLPVLIVVKTGVFAFYRLYRGLWRYIGLADLWRLARANLLAGAAFILIASFFPAGRRIPRSIFLIDMGVCLLLTGGVRFTRRLVTEGLRGGGTLKSKAVLIVGAGQAGLLALKEFRRHPETGTVIGFIDDDPAKKNETLDGVRIFGGREMLPEVVEGFGVEKIVIAMPSAAGSVIRRIIESCRNMPGVMIRIVPGIRSLLSGRLEVKPREVKPEDLLGRPSVNIDPGQIRECLKGKTILISGAGGSIGSEICRQAAEFAPGSLILLDNHENELYYLTLTLGTRHGRLPFKTVIGNAGDPELLRSVFARLKPEIIFHCAAHKHVPLLESNPAAAVKNNIITTRNLAAAAYRNRVERFVLLSTDKAVNPGNTMGLSKRIAELIVQSFSGRRSSRFLSVRFGNVIGSAGSLVPLLKKQIEDGGPITLTDPRATRYFMSVREAARLVVQAAVQGNNRDIFILDMGEQIKILDIARDLVTLSGLTLEKDIPLRYIGLRPGEKLSEDVLIDRSRARPTGNNKIFVQPGGAIDRKRLWAGIRELEKLAAAGRGEDIPGLMRRIIEETVQGDGAAGEGTA